MIVFAGKNAIFRIFKLLSFVMKNVSLSSFCSRHVIVIEKLKIALAIIDSDPSVTLGDSKVASVGEDGLSSSARRLLSRLG